MLMFIRRAAATLLLAVPAVVCAQSAPPSSDGGEVAARVGDRVITVREVDEAWRSNAPAEHTRATQMLYEGRRGTLDAMVADILLREAAQAKGVPVEQYTRDEIGRRLRPVSDADVASFYQANVARMNGRPLEEMRVPVRSFLEREAQVRAREALVAELKKAGPSVQVLLDPPRSSVNVARNDPHRGSASAPVVLVEFSDYQ